MDISPSCAVNIGCFCFSFLNSMSATLWVSVSISGVATNLIIRAAELAQLDETLVQAEPVTQGHWALDKTGLLPPMLRLAKGTEALGDVRVFRVKPARP